MALSITRLHALIPRFEAGKERGELSSGWLPGEKNPVEWVRMDGVAEVLTSLPLGWVGRAMEWAGGWQQVC